MGLRCGESEDSTAVALVVVLLLLLASGIGVEKPALAGFMVAEQM